MTRAPCEVSWFSALCDDDYEFLGVPDERLRSSWEHCRDIALQAESGGFDNILLPSGYTLGIDTTAFAAGIAPLLRRLWLLMAYLAMPFDLIPDFIPVLGHADDAILVTLVLRSVVRVRSQAQPGRTSRLAAPLADAALAELGSETIIR